MGHDGGGAEGGARSVGVVKGSFQTLGCHLTSTSVVLARDVGNWGGDELPENFIIMPTSLGDDIVGSACLCSGVWASAGKLEGWGWTI